MTYAPYKLAELISTRISHDLAGGIGSVDNLIDCLEAGEPVDSEDKKILEKTAKDLRTRQKFLRIAFGTDTKLLNANELENLCMQYLSTVGAQSRNIKLDIKNVAPELAKYICLCLLTAVEIAIKNTQILIDFNKNNILIKVNSENKLSKDKLDAYNKILNDEDIEERDALQVIQLIYLREILGKKVPILLNVLNENSIEFIIG